VVDRLPNSDRSSSFRLLILRFTFAFLRFQVCIFHRVCGSVLADGSVSGHVEFRGLDLRILRTWYKVYAMPRETHPCTQVFSLLCVSDCMCVCVFVGGDGSCPFEFLARGAGTRLVCVCGYGGIVWCWQESNHMAALRSGGDMSHGMCELGM
jgi:hypothetical protein